jgi:hypothetical protein
MQNRLVTSTIDIIVALGARAVGEIRALGSFEGH